MSELSVAEEALCSWLAALASRNVPPPAEPLWPFTAGFAAGEKTERARIRKELLEAWPDIIGYPDANLMAAGPTSRLRAALDRISLEVPGLSTEREVENG